MLLAVWPVLIVACSRQDEGRSVANEQDATLPRFPCASGPLELRPNCTAERSRTDKGWLLTLRHPDGHFRRLLVSDDSSVSAADGAEPAQVTPGSAGVAIAIGRDRYLLPVQR